MNNAELQAMHDEIWRQIYLRQIGTLQRDKAMQSHSMAILEKWTSAQTGGMTTVPLERESAL